MRAVVALGGNALLRRGESAGGEGQRENVRLAARAVASLAPLCDVTVTHGNGPQIGLLAMESYAFSPAHPGSLDVLGAESQGLIGYMLETALRNELPGREIVTALGQVLVDAADPAFGHPTKFIGPVMTADEAVRLASERGWAFAPEAGGQRRVVPSPEPRAILEAAPLRRLVEAGVLVISAGGGGVPVIQTDDGSFGGVEAVVDKDLTAALLAEQLHADWLLMLTDVPAVSERWGDPASRRFRSASPARLRAFSFAPGSMGPKVEAACRFVERTGGTAAIGALGDARAVIEGRAGTVVRPSGDAIAWW